MERNAFRACAALAVFLLFFGAVEATAESSEGQEVLVFEKSIRLDYVPETIEWSPDNRRLAVKGSSDGKLHVIDRDDESARDRVVLDSVGGASIAWSLDGKIIAVHQSSPFYGIRLVSIADGRETARWQMVPGQQVDMCASAGMPMAFTDDGASLWVTCQLLGVGSQTNFTVAVKYRLPDFVAIDRVEFRTALPDSRIRAFVYSLVRTNGDIGLSAIVGFSSLGSTRRFAYGVELGSKTELFPRFEIVDDTRSGLVRAPSQIIALPDKSFVLIGLQGLASMKPGAQMNEQFDRLFEGYDARTGQRKVAYGGMSGTDPERGAVGPVSLLRDGRSIVGTWSRAASQEGGLVIFDARTGTVNQRIRSSENYLLALSPDGRRAVNVTRGGEMRFYGVK